MRLRSLLFAAIFVFTGCGGGTGNAGFIGPTPTPVPSPVSHSAVVPCSSIANIRDLGPALSYVTNPRTGDTIEYTIVGDAAVSNDILLMFPGTGQIMTGWPTQLLTNAKYSPLIAATASYDPLENGTISLCHNYRIALFDFPGVGNTPASPILTRDNISSDIDAMLDDATTRYRIPTNLVDPVGWSLGTSNAAKYAILSPTSNPSRTVHNVILIAGGPGSSEQAQIGADSASCVTQMFDASLTASGTLADELKLTLSKMIFPFVGQTKVQSGTASGCTATIANNRLTLSVTPDCSALNHCLNYLAGTVIDSFTFPWSLTKGLDDTVYAQERKLSHDFDVAYCSGGGPNFTSTGCITYAPVEVTALNGGICQTNTSNPDVPVASTCAPMHITGSITDIDGYEDLLTQWTYGKALIDAYARAGYTAKLDIYPGAAGHGVMVQHPLWTQTQISNAMQP